MMYLLSKTQCRLSDSAGFSLIEVMVVAVLIGIIASIAIPMNRDQLVEAYVPEAEAVLASISIAEQRCRLLHGGFNNSNCTLAKFGPAPAGAGYVDTGSTAKWTFTLSASSPDIFTATASGKTTNSDLSGKTITLTYNFAATPHESKIYNF